MALVFLILVPAVICDIRTDRIPNSIIVVGFLTGMIYQSIHHGIYGILQGMASAMIPFIVLFPIFTIRGLGAGDIKLLAVAGTFLSVDKSKHCLIFSLIFGAVFALIKMLYQRNFIERIQYFISYVRRVYETGHFFKYNTEATDATSKIHMSIPILLAVLLGIGGFY